MNELRNLAGRGWHVERVMERRSEDAARNFDGRQLVGERIEHLRLARTACQPVKHGFEFFSQFGKCRATCFIGSAAVKQQIHGPLPFTRKGQRSHIVHRRDCDQNHAANVCRMALDVDLRRARPVRSAIQIDPLITKRRADIIQIVHGDGRGVEPQISLRLKLRAASADGVHWK